MVPNLMAPNRPPSVLDAYDGDTIAYALSLTLATSLFVACTSGELVAPFVPEHWQTAVNAISLAAVLMVAGWRRWQLFESSLKLVDHLRRDRRLDRPPGEAA